MVFKWWRRRRRRRHLANHAWPTEWTETLDRLPLYQRLPTADRPRLRDITQILLHEQRYEGCGGQRIDDEVRVTIAAQAALLLLGIEHNYFSNASTVLVYPAAFVNPIPQASAGGLVRVGVAAHGEAWQRGPVVLDWDATAHGTANGEDGRNVVLHEFAHKLDMLDGYADGHPPQRSRGHTRRWQVALGAAFTKLQAADRKGRASVLDKYGATNPAEFFAVATEAFFEKGPVLKRKRPDVYEVLADYFGQNPADWS